VRAAPFVRRFRTKLDQVCIRHGSSRIAADGIDGT
jgi:hypothetical protein